MTSHPLSKDKFNRGASSGIFSGSATVVLRHAFLKILGYARIEGSIRALQYVDIPGLGVIPLRHWMNLGPLGVVIAFILYKKPVFPQVIPG